MRILILFFVVLGTPAHARFQDVTTRKQLLNDLRQLSPDTQTYALESFHSVLNGFAAKAFAFSAGGMLARYVAIEKIKKETLQLPTI